MNRKPTPRKGKKPHIPLSMTSEEFKSKYAPNILEEDVQRAALDMLRLKGYTALQTSHRVRMSICPKCSHKFRGDARYGSTPGVPDLLVTRRNWPVGVFLGIEIKGPKTPLSVEQIALVDAGRIVICRSALEALNAAEAFGEPYAE